MKIRVCGGRKSRVSPFPTISQRVPPKYGNKVRLLKVKYPIGASKARRQYCPVRKPWKWLAEARHQAISLCVILLRRHIGQSRHTVQKHQNERNTAHSPINTEPGSGKDLSAPNATAPSIQCDQCTVQLIARGSGAIPPNTVQLHVCIR